MKKLIHLCLALLFPLSVFSQEEYNYSQFESDQYLSRYEPIDYKLSKKAKKITYEVQYAKKSKTEKHIKEFNKNGDLTSYYFQKGNKQILPQYLLVYDSLKLIKLTAYKNGKIKNVTEKKWNKKGSITEIVKRNAKQKEIHHSTWEYNENNCMTNSIRYKKGTNKVEAKWVYEYYDEKCKRAKSTLLDKNGKIKNVWTYDCTDEGAKLEKRKKETQVCTWNKQMDSILIKAYQTFDEKGKVIKYIEKYTLKDTLILETSYFDKNDKLKFHAFYDKSFDKCLHSISYSKKGKKQYEYVKVYNKDLLISNSFYWKGKANSKAEFKYNSNGLLEEVRETARKGKPYKTTKITYEE